MNVTPLNAASLNVAFNTDLESLLPRLRLYAMSLTRNAERAEDLVQQTALKALSGRGSFRAGSNFAAWMFRIQRNEFVSELRRMRPTVDIDSPAALAKSSLPVQENGLVFAEFMAAFRQLPRRRREALLMATVEGLPYGAIAEHTGVAVGAVKSRVWRGRAQLKNLLDLEIATPPRQPTPETGQCLRA